MTQALTALGRNAVMVLIHVTAAELPAGASAKVVGAMAAHVLLPWSHRVFANPKRRGTGVLHGFRLEHLE